MLPITLLLLSHHRSNKTVDSVFQLTDSHYILDDNKDEVKEKLSKTPFIQKIIPAMVNYYETNKYIFVHGWIPCNKFRENRYCDRYEAIDDWRNASPEDWYFARWTNGMEAWNAGVKEQGKTIVLVIGIVLTGILFWNIKAVNTMKMRTILHFTETE